MYNSNRIGSVSYETNKTPWGARRINLTPNKSVWVITVFALLISIMVGYSMVDNTFNIEGRSTISTTTLIRISSLKEKDATGGSEPYYPYYYGVYLWKRIA